AKSFRMFGKLLRGPLHLWSGDDTGKPAAKAAIAAEGKGYIMGRTPEHQAAKAKYEAAMNEASIDASGRKSLPQSQHQRIWDKPSETVSAKAAAAEHPVATHVDRPGSVQSRVERPTISRVGTLSGVLSVLSGAINMYGAAHSGNKAVKAVGTVAAGV